MSMNLNRDSKTGEIKEKNISPTLKIAIGIGIGTIVICGMFSVYKNISNKSSSKDLDEYLNYAQQVESLYDVDISNSNEEILNGMQKNLDLVNQYNEALTDDERYEALAQMMNTKSELTTASLSIIKQEYAEEYGGVAEDYDIFVRQNDGIYNARKLVNHYGSVDIDETYNLNGKQKELVNYIINLDEASYNKDLGIGKESKEFVDKYESVIKKSAKYIGKTSDKAK